ncbi:MAG: SPASM domain-containing protein [Pseudonocardiaceae bacterium]
MVSADLRPPRPRRRLRRRRLPRLHRPNLDRISIFPDGGAYVCSFLFDTDLHFANMIDGQIVVNKNDNEFDLFTRVLTQASCGGCKVPGTCMGGCPAEELVMGSASCASEPDIVPICRLWKADIGTTTAAVS